MFWFIIEEASASPAEGLSAGVAIYRARRSYRVGGGSSSAVRSRDAVG